MISMSQPLLMSQQALSKHALWLNIVLGGEGDNQGHPGRVPATEPNWECESHMHGKT